MVKKSNNGNRLFLTGLILAGGLVLAGAATNGQDVVRPFRIFAPPPFEDSLRELTEAVYQNCDFLFGPMSAGPTSPLHIYLEQEPPRQATENGPISLLVDESDNLIHLIAALADRVIQQRIRQIQGTGQVQPAADYSWLAAAVAYGALQATPEQKVQFRINYQPLEEIFRSNHFPDLEFLVSHPVQPDDQSLFYLYSMHCHLLLNLIRGPVTRVWRSSAPTPTFAVQLLILTARGTRPIEALNSTVQQIEDNRLTPQKWYENNAPALAQRSISPISSRRVIEELFYILTIEVPDQLPSKPLPGDQEIKETEDENDKVEPPEAVENQAGNGLLQRQPLAEFDHQAFWSQNRNLARSRHNRLLWLFPRTPLLLQEPMTFYMDAMIELRQAGHTPRFRQLLREGDRIMTTALAQQQAIEEYLKRIKPELTAPGEYLDQRQLRTIIEINQRRRGLSPELNELLDEIESR